MESRRWALAVFLSIFLLHSLSPVPNSADSRWSVLVASSILDHGDVNLDEYRTLVEASGNYGVEFVNGHIYNWYPLGTPLLATPFVWAIRTVLWLAHPLLEPLASYPGMPPIPVAFLHGDVIGGHGLVEMVIASFFVALTALLLYSIARRDLAPGWAALLAWTFAFGTSAWSTGSRGLFQHTPSMLMLVCTMWLLLNDRVSLAGVSTAFAYVVRPTNGLLMAAVTLYVVLCHRKAILGYAASLLSLLVLFTAYNWHTFGALQSSYYTLRPPLPDARVVTALLGNLISPGRGLFLFTPVLLFSLWGMVKARRTRWNWPLAPWWVGLIVAHWLTISLFADFWWGGHSYGPRLFLDVVPLFVLFLIPLFRDWQTRRGPAFLVFCAALVLSVAIHSRAATSLGPLEWSIRPNNIDQHPERIWDWSDPAFLRR
jgi:hypothetical protein